jgi:hypothetical protein
MKIGHFAILFCFCCGIFLYSSCERLHIKIGYIKNNTNTDLAGAEWDNFMADSLLCNDRINLDYYIQPGLFEELSTRPNKGDLQELPDSSKQYIYIFNLDSLNKYQKLKICEGIVKRCLVKKIEIQLNKVKEPMDTVYINSAKISN